MTRTVAPPIEDQLPPHSIEAEQCLLGSMMLCLTREDFELMAVGVVKECFFQVDHEIVFDCIAAIWRSGSKCDAVILREELYRRKILEEVGGAQYIAEIINSMPSAAHGPHYAKIVKEKHLLRTMIDESNRILRRCYAPMVDGMAMEIAAGAVARLTDMAAAGSADDIVTIQAGVDEVVVDLEHPETTPRVKTGLNDLDELTGGLPLGGTITIAGPQSMGKSAIWKQIVMNAAEAGLACGVVSIEETYKKIARNMLSTTSGVQNRKISRSQIDAEDWAGIRKGQERMEPMKIFIADKPNTLVEVLTATTSLVLKHHCKIVVVDFLQLVRHGEPNENARIDAVISELKAVFKRLGVAGIVISQMNRDVHKRDNHRPRTEDLRGSGAIEAKSDVIILLHSEDFYRAKKGDQTRNHKLELIVAKNKDGASGDVYCHYDMDTQRVRDWQETIPLFAG